MNNNKPLTKSELVAALEEAGVATKDDIVQLVGDEVFEKMTEFHDGLTMPTLERHQKEIRSVIEEIGSKIDELQSEVAGLQVEVRGLKNDVEGLSSELSDKEDRRRFNQLKARVDTYHPLP